MEVETNMPLWTLSSVVDPNVPPAVGGCVIPRMI